MVFLTIDDATDPRPNFSVVLDASLAESALWREYLEAPLGKERLAAVPFVAGLVDVEPAWEELSVLSWSFFSFLLAGGLPSSLPSLGEEEEQDAPSLEDWLL